MFLKWSHLLQSERQAQHLTVLFVLGQFKIIKLSSFKSSENIQKNEGGPDRSVSDNQSSSVTLNELAMKARKIL